MVVVWGSNLYGKVDEVPGLGWVATKFGHLYYVPLIPMGSYIVFEQDGDEWQGVETGLSGKSVLVAYLRAVSVVVALAGAIALFVSFSEGITSTALIGGLALAAGIGAYVGTKLSRAINNASYMRAKTIAGQIGLNDEGKVLLDFGYGKIDNRTCKERLAMLETQRAHRDELAAACEAERKAKARVKAEERKRAKGSARLRAKAKAPKRRRRLAARR